ncbi:uncharacterized protein BYT42DRAFT_566309 [Radiomyces spectabilis]|uniref:uncharacterized protein n=1 Tax=Radiomyces spectabilis TaxID=64574 RepID=UPI00221EA48C|nr:uncharacterized protein BYT42DRAFT_566309 [Radiomyces spectabilis]KAI8381374.1 hypothetical protein BYT42DRAFT_566309 [Radiomyces spectabilis]
MVNFLILLIHIITMKKTPSFPLLSIPSLTIAYASTIHRTISNIIWKRHDISYYSNK